MEIRSNELFDLLDEIIGDQSEWEGENCEVYLSHEIEVDENKVETIIGEEELTWEIRDSKWFTDDVLTITVKRDRRGNER